MTEPYPHNNAYNPSPWIERFAERIPRGGKVLDLACGSGRHGQYFLRLGHDTVFVDKNTAALNELVGHERTEITEADLETDAGWPLGRRTFGAVIVANYLWRPILPNIVAAIAPGGLLLYETFALGNEAYGRPRNPDFLLRPGELLDIVRGQLDMLAYEQIYQDVPSPRVIQHIAARRPL